ncbi:MAG: LPS-assembly protein LptD [Bacteroidales bacterium]|nr:LPS-assembly protein LptD [Bacteroidales bacterium]
MSIKLLTSYSLKTTILILLFVTLRTIVFSQDTLKNNVPDSLLFHADTLTIDTSEKKTKVKGLKSKIECSAIDSIRFNVVEHKVYLFNEGEINYEKIDLQANYIDIDFDRSLVFAIGVPDSNDKIIGSPVFTEEDQIYKSKEMHYNYETEKGLIKHVFTQDGEGYIHGEIIKKMGTGEINVKSGSYTTCNREDHPHFEFKYNKSKFIPGKKIITGPAYLVIEGVPTPLFIPFGLFPNKSGQRSGIVIPTYGESASRGFYFENGGYYWALNDYLDLKLTGDIYTRGSWAIKPNLRYRKRYKYNGSFNLGYATNIVGQEGSADYQKSNDFSIRWIHSQDPKARPNSKFSANVNIVSNKFNRFNPTTTEQFLSNTFQSSVAYQTNWNGKVFLTANASHSQNTQTKMVSLTLPEVSLSVNRFYPLRNSSKVGQLKWYDNISVNYSMNTRNTISVEDSLLFEPSTLSKFQNGIKHSIPISSSIKILKYFTMTNSVNITDRMYFEKTKKYWDNDTVWTTDTTYYIGQEMVDTISGFNNVLDFRLSSSISTKIYGMLAFKKGPIRAIRHVFTPSVGFSYTPDFGADNWGYYDSYVDGEGNEVDYSKFETGIYGTPPGDKSGSINFSLSNNLEIKVPSKKDTITGMKKVKLIENFTISGSYDLARDSLNWSKIRMSGRTKLFDKLNITYSSSWDPYVLDSAGTGNLNQFEWDVNKKLLRLDNTTWNLGLSYSLNSEKLKKSRKSDKGTEQELADINENLDQYIDWNIPWSLNINYNLRYTNTNKYINNIKTSEDDLVQTLGFSGDISITPKWKLAFRSGYDFESKELSYTSLNIHRDLHCWQMSFNWIPMGPRKSWNFTLNVKSSILQDLKLEKKKDFRDY